MGIIRTSKPLTKTQQRTLWSFEEAFRQILNKSYNYETGENYVADYLRDLDAKSSVTLEHSIYVAALTFDDLSSRKTSDGKPVFTREEILDYTRGALMHDVGKLRTKDSILHTTHGLTPFKYNKDGSYNQDYTKFNHMMQHSLDGIKEATARGFDKVSIFVSLAHHISASCIESGPEKGFENATISRDSWEIKNGKGFVEKMLMKHCSWITEKDKLAIKTIALYDVVEALRSSKRAYMIPKKWDVEKPGDNPYDTVRGIFRGNLKDKVPFHIKENELVDSTHTKKEKEVVLRAFGKELEHWAEKDFDQFKSNFNRVISLPIVEMARDMMTEYYRNLPDEIRETKKTKISDTRIKEIEQNPEEGRALFELKKLPNGKQVYVLEDNRLEKPLIYQTKAPEPNFEKPLTINDITLDGEKEKSGVQKYGEENSLDSTELDLEDVGLEEM